ncbi:uncharacterized protein LOC110188481 [Drosophila serrata]|uniref:uncharacterized protein LOC110188481 n=1 Tax=Drosophila serrata TaxID=7274 RepID=UPI000A1D31E9|nr:uncharacterized protein LOC110188481 [Drosophila serrata]
MTSSNPLLGISNENKRCMSYGNPTFKIYYGVMRKAAIIAFIQQKRLLKTKMMAENGKNKELLYLNDVIEKENSQYKEDFSDINKDSAEIKTIESTEDNSTLTLLQENVQQNQESKALSNEVEQHAQKSNLLRAIHTYEPPVLPRMAIVLPRPRKFPIIAFTTNKTGFEKRIIAEKVKKYELDNTNSQCGKEISDSSMDIGEIKDIELTEENSTSKDLSPDQESNLQRAIHIDEPQVLPRMAIVLPKPHRGRTVWINPIGNQFPSRQFVASLHMRMTAPPKDVIWGPELNKQIRAQIKKIIIIMKALQDFKDLYGPRYLEPKRTKKPKYKAFDILLIFLLIIIIIAFSYYIWTLSLPEEILLTLSGMFTAVLSYIYFLVMK